MPGKDGVPRDVGRYVRGSAGGLAGRDSGGVLDIVPCAKTKICYYKVNLFDGIFLRRKFLEIRSWFKMEF